MPKAPVNGINMYYEVHGKGVPLVMIQGFAGNHQAWFFQTPVFKKYYKVVIFDNRGIGRTDQSRRALYYQDDGGRCNRIDGLSGH